MGHPDLSRSGSAEGAVSGMGAVETDSWAQPANDRSELDPANTQTKNQDQKVTPGLLKRP